MNSLILQAVGDGIYVTDREDRALFVNPAAERLLGYASGELIGKRAHEIMHHSYPDGSPYPQEACPITLTLQDGCTRQGDREFFWRKNGESFPTEYVCSALFEEGQIVGAVFTFRDVSVRHRLERKLTASESRFRALVETSPTDLIFLKDLDGRYLYINPAGADYLGFPPETIIGKRDGDLMPPRDARRHSEEEQSIMTSGNARSLDVTLETRQGEQLCFISTKYPYRSADGAVIGVMGISRDITEIKELQRQLQEQNAKLQDLDRLKSQFINAISHDLRAPLTSIRGYAELLGEDAGAPLNARQNDFLQQIEKGIHRIDVMISDLLDLARAEAGALKLVYEDTDVAALLSEITASLVPLSDQMGVTMSVACPSELPVACLDTPRVGRVLTNLLQNAIKFSPPGGRIDVRLRPLSEGILCEITDTGPGIDAGEITRLFERYRQLEAGIQKGGTGLGLSISKTIVEAHGGRIGVRSAPGKGSTFWFSMPLRPESHS